jgi:hypothetical protein
MITEEATGKKVEILLVEDNPGDVRLTMEALKDGKVLNDLSVVGDGVVDFVQFANVIKSIEDFWLTIVKLPQNGGSHV